MTLQGLLSLAGIMRSQTFGLNLGFNLLKHGRMNPVFLSQNTNGKDEPRF